MEFHEIAAILGLATAAMGTPICILMNAVEIRDGDAAKLDTRRNRIMLWGMSLMAGAALVMLGQPPLIATLATLPGIIACEVLTAVSENARGRERAE